MQPGDDLSFLFGWIPDITEHLKDLPTTTLAILMIIYVSSQVGSMLLMPSTADPRYKYLFAGMPILFAVFIINQAFPVGLMLYWITTNLWTVGQAGVIRQVLSRRPRSWRCRRRGRRATTRRAAPAKRTEPKPPPKPKPSGSAEQPSPKAEAVRRHPAAAAVAVEAAPRAPSAEAAAGRPDR